MAVSASKLCLLAAVIVFVLAAAGVTVGDLDTVRLVAGGLAVFAASFLVP